MNMRLDALANLAMWALGLAIAAIVAGGITYSELQTAKTELAFTQARVQALEKRVGITWETPWEKIQTK